MEWTERDPALVLPASQLSLLALIASGRQSESVESILSTENCERLAPSLHGLRLTEPTTHLARLANLTYLDIGVYSPWKKEDSLLSALDAMPQLCALEIRIDGRHSFWEETRPIDSFPAHCPNLEHLSLNIHSVWSGRRASVLLSGVSGLERLRSLHLRREASLGNWDWFASMAEKGRLEWVRVDTKEDVVPLDLARALIRNCKVGGMMRRQGLMKRTGLHSLEPPNVLHRSVVQRLWLLH